MKNKRKITMNIGIISFLMMFIILCMVTFSILSLVSAQTNEELDEKSIAHKEAYYALCNKAETSLEQLDDALYTIYQANPTQDTYYAAIKDIKKVNESMKIKERTITFYVQNKSQKLHVEIEVLFPGKHFYKLNKWNLESTKEWKPENGLNVL